MKKLIAVTTVALTLMGGAALAQTTPDQATTPAGHDASKGQLEREHKRAVKAGDTANDPMNSSSSDALNQKQLQGTTTDAASSSATGTDSGGPTTPPPATPDTATTPPAPDTSTPPPTLPSTDSSASSSSSSSQ